jgi:hypothetical protein
MTTRNLVDLSTLLLVSLAMVQGAMADTVACPTTGTYQDLLNTDAGGGCTISVGGGASLIFSDFTFTPAGNVGTPAANEVGYHLDDPGVGPGGEPIWGFQFNPGFAVTGTTTTPDATEDTLLTYKIVPVGTTIDSDDLLENAAATGAGVGQVSEDIMFCIASDPNNTSGTCRTFHPLLVSTVVPPGLQDNVTFGHWTSMTVSKNISASSGAVGGTATISQVRDSVDITSAIKRSVPEPTTYGLMSIGLLTIYFGRRRPRDNG